MDKRVRYREIKLPNHFAPVPPAKAKFSIRVFPNQLEYQMHLFSKTISRPLHCGYSDSGNAGADARACDACDDVCDAGDRN